MSPTRPTAVPAVIPSAGPPAAMIAPLATGNDTGAAQHDGDLRPQPEATHEGGDSIGSNADDRGSGGELLGWALWPDRRLQVCSGHAKRRRRFPRGPPGKAVGARGLDP